MNTWTKVHSSKTELEGPYECSGCEGHVMLDGTFLDQVSNITVCPYCQATLNVKEADPVDKTVLFESLKAITKDEQIPQEFIHIGSIDKVYPNNTLNMYRADIWQNADGLRIATWDQGNGYCDFISEGTIDAIAAYLEAYEATNNL